MYLGMLSALSSTLFLRKILFSSKLIFISLGILHNEANEKIANLEMYGNMSKGKAHSVCVCVCGGGGRVLKFE